MTTEQMDWVDDHNAEWQARLARERGLTPGDKHVPPSSSRRVRPFFRWYDLWVGAYWDRKKRTLYVCPLPMFGIAFGPARRNGE